MLLYIKIINFISLTFFISITSFSQSRVIIGKNISNSTPFTVSIFHGSSTKLMGYLSNENANINLPEKYTGFVRVEIGTHYEDIIVEQDTILLSIKISKDSTLQIESNSHSTESLQFVKNYYKIIQGKITSEKDVEKKNILIEKRDKTIDSILSLHPESFFSRSTKIALLSLKNLTAYQIIDLMPLEDADFVNCSILPKMALNSLKAIGESNQDKLKLVLRYLFDKPMHPEVKNMLYYFLIEFFTSTNADDIIAFFISELTSENFCETELSVHAIEKIKQAELYQIGKRLPDVKINGKKISKIISKYKNKEFYLIIWSQDCPHCISMFTKCNTLKNKSNFYMGIEISDSENNLSFECLTTSVEDKNSWKGELAQMWMISKTPTIFKIDRDLRILSMPETLE